MKVRGLARGGSILMELRAPSLLSEHPAMAVAQVGWFRVVQAAPSQLEHEAPGVRERACTSTGRSFQTGSFLPFQGFCLFVVSCRVGQESKSFGEPVCQACLYAARQEGCA